MAGNLQINRNYELTIGDARSTEAVIITPPMGISFSVNKYSDNTKKQTAGEIEIYNLPDEAIKKLSGDYPVAILRVAYLDADLVTLIKGEVLSASTRKQGADKITQIRIGSGYITLNHETIEQTLPEGVTVKQAIEIVQKEMKISKGVFSGFNIQNVMLYGYPMNGTHREVLDNLCKSYHLSYTIDNDILSVFDSDGTIDENFTLAPLIDETSGLIDLPYETKVITGKDKNSADNKGGVRFQILLNPTLIAGAIVKIESKTITGFYKIAELRHYGGNRDKDWYTDCRCEDKRKI